MHWNGNELTVRLPNGCAGLMLRSYDDDSLYVLLRVHFCWTYWRSRLGRRMADRWPGHFCSSGWSPILIHFYGGQRRLRRPRWLRWPRH